MVRSVCLVGKTGYERAVEQVAQAMSSRGIKVLRQGSGCDVAVVVGRDRDLLEYLQGKGENAPPLLGIDVFGGSFLAEVQLADVGYAAEKLASNDYRVERAIRIRVVADGREAYALNEVAVFATKPATLLEYELRIDKRLVWRDYADGVIVATPTGSTAYALSVGGPVLHRRLSALVIVPVNSMDVSRRPIVVPAGSRIQIDKLSRPCEAVVDGITRIKTRRHVAVSKGPPARLVKLERSPDLALEKRLRISRELEKMPPSAKLVYKLLEYEGPMSLDEIKQKSLLPDRTVRSALGLLLEAGLIVSKTSLRDARRKIFGISGRETG